MYTLYIKADEQKKKALYRLNYPQRIQLKVFQKIRDKLKSEPLLRQYPVSTQRCFDVHLMSITFKKNNVVLAGYSLKIITLTKCYFFRIFCLELKFQYAITSRKWRRHLYPTLATKKTKVMFAYVSFCVLQAVFV